MINLFIDIFNIYTKKNKIVNSIVEYINELIFYTIDHINISKLEKNTIDHLFACYISVYSYLGWKRRILFNERFDNIYRKEFDQIYEKDKIVEQIKTYGHMLSRHYGRDLFDRYENLVIENDRTNCMKNRIPVPMFKSRNDIPGCT